MTRVILNLIYITYTNADILLNWYIEDENTFPCYWCHALEKRVAKDETQKTLYLLKDIIEMILYVCFRVLDISSEDLT